LRAWQCRSRSRGQGARSRAAAHLRCARLKALNLANAATRTALDLTGIADPQNQGGGAAVTGIKASVAQLGGGSDIALTPAPALGFSGAPRTGWRRQVCRRRAVEAGSVAGPRTRTAAQRYW